MGCFRGNSPSASGKAIDVLWHFEYYFNSFVDNFVLVCCRLFVAVVVTMTTVVCKTHLPSPISHLSYECEYKCECEM